MTRIEDNSGEPEVIMKVKGHATMRIRVTVKSVTQVCILKVWRSNYNTLYKINFKINIRNTHSVVKCV